MLSSLMKLYVYVFSITNYHHSNCCRVYSPIFFGYVLKVETFRYSQEQVSAAGSRDNGDDASVPENDVKRIRVDHGTF